jgi:protein-L-isoaspartate(D-aspartate) O-methyltransferase
MSVVDPFAKARQALVEESLLSSGVTDQRVLKAFLTVLRHEFVFPEYTEQAYADGPLPIGEGQVMTQPSLAARMTQALHLQGHEKVLEIGTGCVYQAAILSLLAKAMYTMERLPALAERAQSVLRRLGYTKVSVFLGDGTQGLPAYAPFDAILVTAGGKRILSRCLSSSKKVAMWSCPLERTEHITNYKLATKCKEHYTSNILEQSLLCL